ncbi:MAG TPA: VOC family protein [Thermoplasmata archaeon]|nr:VOC family protein [Thermoplasmata archaeon]
MKGEAKPPSRKTPIAGVVGKLDEIHVPVRDLARMRRFYETELGLRRAFAHKDRMVALETGGAMLVLDGTKPREGPIYLGFQVTGSAELVARLESGGTRIVQPTSRQHWGELLTIVEDPEGNLLAFEEGSPRPGHHHVRTTS